MPIVNYIFMLNYDLISKNGKYIKAEMIGKAQRQAWLVYFAIVYFLINIYFSFINPTMINDWYMVVGIVGTIFSYLLTYLPSNQKTFQERYERFKKHNYTVQQLRNKIYLITLGTVLLFLFDWILMRRHF